MQQSTGLVEASHTSGELEVRADLTEAQAQVWDRLGEPGTWWTGDERLAIARTVRAALSDPAPLPPWTTPSSEDRLAAEPALSPELQDAVYRLTLQAGTLTEDWYRRMLDGAAITPEQWVEAIEIVVTVVSVDRFAQIAGLPTADLPPAQPGEPSHRRAAAAPARHHWVPVVHPEDATDDYDAFYGSGPDVVPPVIRALSCVPQALDTLSTLGTAQYIPTAEMVDMNWTRGTLTRRQIELVAARISALRECFY